MKISSLIGSIIIMLTFSACAPTNNTRATGQVIDDAATTARVKTEIFQVHGIGDAAKINVTTYRGVVSLSGFVDSQAQKATAAKAARGVSGVTDVQNNLEVKPPTK